VIQHENREEEASVFADSTNLTERFRLFLKENIRFFYPVLIVFSTKLLCSIFFYHYFDLSSTDTAWMIRGYDRSLIGNPLVRWPFLYQGWDSGWHLIIIFKGYFYQAYAFFPGYPISIYLFNLVINDFFASAAVSSLIFGVAWMPFFQATAERHMSREASSRVTLLVAFFPYVFLFTTVAYSESLFLFASVASWYFHQNNKLLRANLLAAVATVTRMLGIFIVLPIFLDLLHRRKYRNFFYISIPVAALFAWFSYCYVNTGEWFASTTVQSKYWNMYSFLRWAIDSVSQGTISDFDGILGSPVPPMIMMIVTLFLIYFGRKVDWRLTLYSISYFLIILCFASLESVARYLSFIFPMWMALGRLTLQGKWGNILTAALCVLFVSIACSLWHRFLLAIWVA